MADEKEDKIVADMDPEGEDFKKMLAGVQTDKVVGKKEVKSEPKSDVKPTDKVDTKLSSDKEGEDKTPEGDAEETADTLKKQIGGLKAELTKRKGQHDKVEELERQLNTLQAELKGRKEASPETDPDVKLKASIAKLTEDELLDEKLIWNERQADARASLRIAQRESDTEAAEKATTELAATRKVLKAIEIGSKELATRKESEAAGEKDMTEKLTKEVDMLFNDAYEALPQLTDKESPLFKAGDAEFRKRPVLMKAMGQGMGELVSLAYAILRNPELVAKAGDEKKAEDVRKDLVNSLDEKISKSFVKSGGSQGTKSAPNYAEVAETNPAEFEKLVNKAKGG